MHRGDRPLNTHARRTEKGQGLAEFALILPILAILLLGILQFAVIFIAQVGLTNAARDIARSASAVPVTTDANARASATSFYNSLTTGSLPRNVATYSSAALVTGATRVCYYSFTDASTTTAIMAMVEIQYQHPIFVPLLQTILGGSVQIGAREDIRVGVPPLTAPTDVPDVTAPAWACNP
jgi:Flp pilus assembly protein TadG